MRRVLLAALIMAIALVGLGGCAAPKAEEDHGGVDEAIHELESHFGAFYLLGASASLKDVQSVLGDIDASWAELTEAAAEDDDHDITAVTTSYEALKAAAAGLTEEAPMPAIEPFVADFKAQIDVLHEAGDFH